MQKIRAVILDLDGTLYDYDALDRVAFARVGELVRERLGVSEEQYGEAFMRARKSTKKKLGETAPSHSRMLYFQKTLEYLDIRPLYLALEMYETYWGFFLDNMVLYPGARKLLDALHDKYIRVAVCTDLGVYNDYTVECLKGMDALLLEANHDVNMLQVGPYPYYLKQRILGERGHLSNENTGRLLCRILHDGLKAVLLGHLSKENNLPELAFESVRMEINMGDNPYKAGDFDIRVARRSEVTPAVVV